MKGIIPCLKFIPIVPFQVVSIKLDTQKLNFVTLALVHFITGVKQEVYPFVVVIIKNTINNGCAIGR
jgi:hypothetical protein